MTEPIGVHGAPVEGLDEIGDLDAQSHPARVHRPALAVLAVGILITALLVVTSWSLNSHNESRLLNLQAKQVASVLTAAIPTTQTPLELGAEVAEASEGNVAKFQSYMATQVGTPEGFSAASLWKEVGGQASLVTSLGAPSPLDSSTSVADTAVGHAFRSSTFVVVHQTGAGRNYLGYAFALPGAGNRYAVYAERPLPANRKARVAQNSAFSDLDYAIYLGGTQSPSQLLTTDIAQLPVSGAAATVTVPFGDTVLTTVVTARVPLGGALSANLPWIIGVLGILLTLGAALLTERLARRRRTAEQAESEIRQVYRQLETLYGQQRTIAETLQRALLPQALPHIPSVDVAARYLPGARGVDIGGDWYSVMNLKDGRFVFVVGDVSGRGLAAASIMARLRFTIRAHALDGDSPALILDKCTRQLSIDADGHFATVLVGLGDLDRGEITFANAGHLPPFIMSREHAGFVGTQPGLPIGISNGPYGHVTIPLLPNSTILAFTDGLVERRGENIDIGLKRFEDAAQTTCAPSLDDLVSHVLDELDGSHSEDDIAILALRWKD